MRALGALPETVRKPSSAVEPYENMAGWILERSAEDYIEALAAYVADIRKISLNRELFGHKVELNYSTTHKKWRDIVQIRSFFKSEWFDILSGPNFTKTGEEVIRLMDNRVCEILRIRYDELQEYLKGAP